MSTRERSAARVGIAQRTTSNGQTQYRGTAYDRRAKRHLRGPWTPSLAEARGWRIDALASLRAGTLSAHRGPTLTAAATAWVADARKGLITTRSGEPYKPAALRGYEQAFRLRILPAIGATHIREITRADLQNLIARWRTDGIGASRIRNTITALRALFRHAVAHGDITINPTTGLQLPAVRGTRDHVVAPAEAQVLLAALASPERAIWACAFYAGLRLGEIRALHWEDIDLPGGVIHISRGWDDREGEIQPKSRAGVRDIPIYKPLRAHLAEHELAVTDTDGLVFGRDSDRAFNPCTINARAARAWNKAGLQRVGLHEARHCAASFMIAAGMNLKAISTFMGHSSITVTLDRYGHLLPGSRAEAISLMDAYLDRHVGEVCN